MYRYGKINEGHHQEKFLSSCVKESKKKIPFFGGVGVVGGEGVAQTTYGQTAK